MRPSSPRVAAATLVAACIPLMVSGRATGQPAYTWSNPNGGTWSTGANWVGGTVPASSPTTVLNFNAVGILGYTTSLNIPNFTCNALNFNDYSPTAIAINGSGG